MTVENYIKLPRLYVDQNLTEGISVTLTGGQAHYLKTVLRREAGRKIRLFNGRDGEWLGEVTVLSKKEAAVKLTMQTRTRPEKTGAVHLLFAPLKKQRLDFLIEKGVELGATDFHPVLTARTEVRKLNTERITAQITEAAEQCERLDRPVLHDFIPLERKLTAWDAALPLFACLEREEAPYISTIVFPQDRAFLIGPAGGFENQEKERIKARDFVRPVSLGETLLRAETAALKCLSFCGGKHNCLVQRCGEVGYCG